MSTFDIVCFDTDKGVVWPFRVTEGPSETPVDITLASSVVLNLSDGTVLPLTVTNAANGDCEHVYMGTMSAGVKRGNLHVTYDATHSYTSQRTMLIHIRSLGS